MTQDKEVTQSESTCFCNARCPLPKRYLVAMLSFLGFANIYAMRVNLSVAIAVMVANQTVIQDGNEVQEPAEFSWSTEIQGIALSAFYFGYVTTQLPSGVLARKFGGATLLGLSVGTSGALTLLTPFAARAHVGLLIALRIAIGMAEGFVYPAGHALWSQWAPPLERTKLAIFNPSGSRLGIIISMFLSGYLAYNFGWPSIFYVFGICAILWSLVWFALVTNSPSKHRWISAEELDLIESSLADDLHTKDVPIPWKAIFTSLPLWAIVLSHFTQAWGLYTMMSELPLYFNQRLHFDLKQTSFASALPYIIPLLVMMFGGQLADYLRKHYLSTGTVRKIFNTIGFIPMVVFPIAAGYVTPSDHVTAIAMMTLGIGLNGFAETAFLVNHLDIAPAFASVLFGITNTAGTMSGIITPILTGLIVQHHSAEEWRIVFFINGAIYLVGGTFYVLFASGEKQPWANGNEYDKLPLNELSSDELEQ
ncbi:hypothetical protein ACROYT_G029712 [Oculina patagonica]